MLFLILNGKKAEIPVIRDAVTLFREKGRELQVRVTWENGDGQRFVEEAARLQADRVVAGGGDGTVQEVASALSHLAPAEQPVMGILPLGTANDFAGCCMVPEDPFAALELAADAEPVAVDMVSVGERRFINVASAGFGAAVTADTPPELKNFFGGGAYTMMGIIKILNFTPYRARLWSENFEFEGEAVLGAICNGRQAGGGQVLAPAAYINDGLFDVILVRAFPVAALDQVIAEVKNLSKDGEFVTSFQASWLESSAAQPVPVNLDGEPFNSWKYCHENVPDRSVNHRIVRYQILPGAVRLALPAACPCVIKR
jgi:lipid kinase YegS